MSNVKTINLTGGETEVIFGQKFRCFWIQNLGDSDIYASPDPGVVPEADGVITIGAGASARVSAADLSKTDRLYLTGSGKVQIMGGYSAQCPFKAAPKGGESAGTTNYNDLSNKPMFDGKPLEGDMSFEDLGWYPLKKQDAVEIFNNAVEKIGPYVTIAEMPLKDSLDGYGVSIIQQGWDINNNISDDGLYIGTDSSWIILRPSLQNELDSLIVEFDFKVTNLSGVILMILPQNYNSNKYYFLIEGNHDLAFQYSKNYQYDYMILVEKFDDINNWNHVSIKFNKNEKNAIVTLNGIQKILDITLDNYSINEYCRFAFGRCVDSQGGTYSAEFRGYIKNIKFKIPKEDK